MDKYENENYLKQMIMRESRHHFIYGFNIGKRSEFLKSLEDDYPIKVDSDSPIALYLDCFGFPEIKTDLKDRDEFMKHVASRDFMSLSIALRILERSSEQGFEFLNERLQRLIELMNMSKNMKNFEIKSVEDLLSLIKESRDFYFENYTRYMQGQIDTIPYLTDAPIAFFQIDTFVKAFKRGMGIHSWFSVIFDKKDTIPIESTKAINDLLSRRINEDISVNVAVEPDAWDSFVDSNGQHVQYIHDYGTIELDDSHEKYMKRIMK